MITKETDREPSLVWKIIFICTTTIFFFYSLGLNSFFAFCIFFMFFLARIFSMSWVKYFGNVDDPLHYPEYNYAIALAFLTMLEYHGFLATIAIFPIIYLLDSLSGKILSGEIEITIEEE